MPEGPQPRPRRAIHETPGPETQLLLDLLRGGGSERFEGHRLRFEKLLGRLVALDLADHEGALTQLAREVAPFVQGNINARMAVALGASRWYGTTLDTITVVSMLAAECPFFVYPGDSREEACQAHRAFQQEGSTSDLITFLHAFERMEEAYNRGGEPEASGFARINFLNFRVFLEIRLIRARLLSIATECGWIVNEDFASEEALTATFFWGYWDRLQRRTLDLYEWEPLGGFTAEIQRDSLHYSDSDAELLICLGVIWKTGDPTGSTCHVAVSAISPELIAELVGDSVQIKVESLALEGGGVGAFDVWYWGDQRLCLRVSALPAGSPLEVLEEMHRRTKGEIPFEPTFSTSATSNWADLVQLTGLPDIEKLLATAWLDFPDEIRVGENMLAVQYSDDGTITIVIGHEQAARLLTSLTPDHRPPAWSNRVVMVAVDMGDGEPITCTLVNVDALRQLFIEA